MTYTIYLYQTEGGWVAQIDPLALSCFSNSAHEALDAARDLVKQLKSEE